MGTYIYTTESGQFLTGWMMVRHPIKIPVSLVHVCILQLFKLYTSLVHVLFNCLNYMQLYAFFDFVVIITKRGYFKQHVLYAWSCMVLLI